jgi:hypothetical protein
LLSSLCLKVNVNINVRVMRMRNRLSKSRGSIDDNLTWCLQRYIVFQYERMIKYLILIQTMSCRNEFTVSIILILIFIAGREKCAEQIQRVSTGRSVDRRIMRSAF